MTARVHDLDAQGMDQGQGFFGGVVNAAEVLVEPFVGTILEKQDLGKGQDRHQGIDDVMTERHHHWAGIVRQFATGVVVIRHSSGRLASGRNVYRRESKYRFGDPRMTTATTQRSDGL